MSEPEMFEHLRGIFFEEAREGTETMESGLMALDEGSEDGETLNAVFRAAHSIKGSAGGFGFSALVEFTHVLESLLDQLRSGKRTLEPRLIDVLLRSTDHLQALLDEAAGQGAADQDRHADLLTALNELAQGVPGEVSKPDVQLTQPAASRTMAIGFRPHRSFFEGGSDPYLLFRELQSLGEVIVSAKTDKLAPLEALDAQELYISWDILLESTADLDAIREVFAWSNDRCELEIVTLTELWDDEPEPSPPAKQEEPAKAQQSKTEEKAAQPTPSPSIRVGIEKIDGLMDIVGELVITQSMLTQIEKEFDVSRLPQLRDGLEELSRQTRELQESVMRVRMVPISAVFSRFPRLVRDVRSALGKQVELSVIGEGTEVDKTVSEQLADPLTHLVRNALDHGLEGPEDREAAGKEACGRLSLSARHEGGNLVIEIEDDGRGIDAEKVLKKARERELIGPAEVPPPERIYDLLFLPGFSTAEKVSALSGRGVGLDVVAKNLRCLGGDIQTFSERGKGTRFSIRLPLTLSILDAQLVRLVEHVFVIPVLAIVESVLVRPGDVGRLSEGEEVYKLRDRYIAVIRASELLGVERQPELPEPRLMVVVENQGQQVGLLVDDLLDQQQIVIKSLETNYRLVPGLSGATILGDGKVAYILDVAGLIHLAGSSTDTRNNHSGRKQWSSMTP